MFYIIDSLEQATTLALNKENWPSIKEHISSAGNTVGLILHFQKFRIDPDYHDELVGILVKIPEKLAEHLNNIQKDEFNRFDLEMLAYELRKISFKQVVPQHPQYSVGLREISLDFRRYVLRWARHTPDKTELIDSISDIRERLIKLNDKYNLLPRSTLEP